MREQALHKTPFHPREIILGDKAYQASQNCLTGWAINARTRPFLTEEQKYYNRKLNGVRQRVSLFSSLFRQLH